MADLILIPTQTERNAIEATLRWDPDRWMIETVGFGVIASGIQASDAIHRHRPCRVVLAGIAGLFADRRSECLQVGRACWFDSVAVHGVGVGEGIDHLNAVELGWRWFESEDASGTLKCQQPYEGPPATLLTVCSGSANKQEAAERLSRHPEVIAEDMESFSVALACSTAKVPLSVVRGFSNLVGCREKSSWQIGEALASVTRCLQQLIDETD